MLHSSYDNLDIIHHPCYTLVQNRVFLTMRLNFLRLYEPFAYVTISGGGNAGMQVLVFVPSPPRSSLIGERRPCVHAAPIIFECSLGRTVDGSGQRPVVPDDNATGQKKEQWA